MIKWRGFEFKKHETLELWVARKHLGESSELELCIYLWEPKIVPLYQCHIVLINKGEGGQQFTAGKGKGPSAESALDRGAERVGDVFGLVTGAVSCSDCGSALCVCPPVTVRRAEPRETGASAVAH